MNEYFRNNRNLSLSITVYDQDLFWDALNYIVIGKKNLSLLTTADENYQKIEKIIYMSRCIRVRKHM